MKDNYWLTFNREKPFQNKIVVVTGGTGSLGKTLVRRILTGELGIPEKIIVFSRDEGKHYQMRADYSNMKSATEEIIYENFLNTLEFRIGDIRDFASVRNVIKDADIVINAAALKQVPSCEYFPYEAIMTNCIGAVNIVRAISETNNHVNTVVFISTDKACHPINVMGTTKSLQERIFISANIQNLTTRFIGVRYGNVLASRGSVIPLFHDQIRNGGPVTITDFNMTRFLLSLDQAVDTVFEALVNARKGEIYIPNVKSTLVHSIALALIGDRDIEIKNIGIRPGEKLHEIMVSAEEANHTIKRGDYFVILPMLPELNMEYSGYVCIDGEFNSNSHLMTLDETFFLLRKNNLIENNNSNGELLR